MRPWGSRNICNMYWAHAPFLKGGRPRLSLALLVRRVVLVIVAILHLHIRSLLEVNVAEISLLLSLNCKSFC